MLKVADSVEMESVNKYQRQWLTLYTKVIWMKLVCVRHCLK